MLAVGAVAIATGVAKGAPGHTVIFSDRWTTCMRVSRKRRWRVEVSDSVETFADAWAALVTPFNSSLFQAYGLMRLFYAELAANRLAEPVIALVRQADGQPAALFPMMRSRRNGLNWLHTDARPLDYSAPVFAADLSPGEIREIIASVLQAVPRADLLYCNKMPAAFLGVANPLIALPNAGRLRFSAWTLPLAGRPEAELLAARQSRFRSSLRSRKQKMAASHRRDFVMRIGSEISLQDFAEFRSLRSQGFEEKNRSDILDDPNWINFYTQLSQNEARHITPWLSLLRADGELIAVLFGFMEGDRPVAIMPGSKMGEWKSLTPGLQLFDETISWFHARNARYLDLSIGDMTYKQRFGCEEIALHDALFPATIIGRLYYIFWRVKVKIRSKLNPVSESFSINQVLTDLVTSLLTMLHLPRIRSSNAERGRHDNGAKQDRD